MSELVGIDIGGAGGSKVVEQPPVEAQPAYRLTRYDRFARRGHLSPHAFLQDTN